MTRPTWDNYFMDHAFTASKMSTCDRANVGCVLVRDKQVLSVGFNGSAKGLPHCNDVGHLMIDGHCKRTIHAEMNAIIQAANHGISTNGAWAYITHFPCLSCSFALINAGIDKVIYTIDYRNTSQAYGFLKLACVEIVRLGKESP